MSLHRWIFEGIRNVGRKHRYGETGRRGDGEMAPRVATAPPRRVEVVAAVSVLLLRSSSNVGKPDGAGPAACLVRRAS